MKFLFIVIILSAIGVYCLVTTSKDIKRGLTKSSDFYVNALKLND